MDRSFYEKEIQVLKQLIHRVNEGTDSTEENSQPQTRQTDALWIVLFLFFLIFGLVGFLTWWLVR